MGQENAPAGSKVSSRASNIRLEGQTNKVPAAARNPMREAKKSRTSLRRYRKGGKKKHNHMKQRVVKRRGRVKRIRVRVKQMRRQG